MKVGVLALAGPGTGGVHQYTLALAGALLSHGTHRYVLVTGEEKDGPFEGLARGRERISIPARPWVLRGLIEGPLRKALPFLGKGPLGEAVEALRAERFDLLVAPQPSLLPVLTGVPRLQVIHDLQHRRLPGFFSLRERTVRDLAYRKAARSAIRVVCESECVKQDIVRFLGVPPERVSVIPSPPPGDLLRVPAGPAELAEARSRMGLPERFLFYPAQFWPHKNHLVLVRGLRLLRDGGIPLGLVLAGADRGALPAVQREVDRLGLGAVVRVLGYVSTPDLACLYRCAEALVMPSLFESLSLPVWEAFSLGVPVASSSVCALPEQVGDAGLLFDPRDPAALAAAVGKLAGDPDLRRELVRRGRENAARQSPERYAREWEAAMEEARRI